MVKMMLRGNSAVQQTHDEFLTLKRYIDGWLYFKEKRKYEKFWFVLKGQVMGGGHLVSAFLFCFKDQNTHVKDHFVGSTQISFPEDTIELHKMEGNEMKPWKCDFVIKLNGEKMRFRAIDNITRDRWIYALVELVGRQLPPNELPALDNSIRPRETKLRNSINRLPVKIKKNIVGNHSPYADNGGTRHPRHSMPEIGFYSPSPVVRSTPISPLVTSDGIMNNPAAEEPTLNGVRIGNIIKQDNTRRSTNQLSRSMTFDSTPQRSKSLQLIDSRIDVQWYYGPMGRIQAEGLLDTQAVGTYLLRDSQSQAGCFTLTYKDHDKKKNHMIVPLSNGQYQFNGSEIIRTFSSPQEGVSFYMEMKKTATFQPKPFIFRSPGDGAEEDSSYLQTDEINKTDENVKKTFKSRPPMTKSPSLPAFCSSVNDLPRNFIQSSNKDHCTKPPVRRVVSNPQTFATRNRAQLRKQSNIEHPTHIQERPMRRAVSLEDYEQMDPVMRSAGQSCTSIPEDDNAYLTGEDIGEVTLDDTDDQDPILPNKEPFQHSYMNSSSIAFSTPISPIRKAYNPPLPPIPDDVGPVLKSENAHVNTEVPAIDEEHDDAYLDMGLGTDDSFLEDTQPSYPPPDYERRTASCTDQADDPYLEMGTEDPEYLTTSDFGFDEPDGLDVNGYCTMGPELPLTTTTTKKKNPPPITNNNTNMVLTPAPKSPIKKSISSSYRQPPPPITTNYQTPLKRQHTSPTSPMFPTSPLSPKLDNDKYVNDLALLMLTKSKPKNNNNSTPPPPPLPPRLAQPQRLVDQTIPNNYGNINS